MGVCASCHNVKTTKKSTTSSSTRDASENGRVDFAATCSSESFRRPSSIMVMNISNGAIKEYKKPVLASLVVSENSDNNDCYISNAESMCVGECMPRVPDEDELLPGRIYFTVPLSHSNYPLSLQLLCDLVVKVNSALSNQLYPCSLSQPAPPPLPPAAKEFLESHNKA